MPRKKTKTVRVDKPKAKARPKNRYVTIAQRLLKEKEDRMKDQTRIEFLSCDMM